MLFLTSTMAFRVFLHSVVIRFLLVVKRALPLCAACLLFFSCADFRGSSVHSAGAHTLCAYIRFRPNCVTQSATKRDVIYCAPLLLMSTPAFRASNLFAVASALHVLSKLPLKYLINSIHARKNVNSLNARARFKRACAKYANSLSRAELMH